MPQSEKDKNLIEALKQKFSLWQVNVVCWDFDGTLINTKLVYGQAMIDASGILLFGQNWPLQHGENQGPEFQKAIEFKKEFMAKVVKGLNSEFGVRPAIMEATVVICGRILGLSQESEQTELALERIRRIFDRDVPPLFEGAMDAVDLINETGVRSILISHAQEQWTWIKRVGTGLIGKFERVICFSINLPKADQWKKQLELLEINPHNLLAIGDRISSDIAMPVRLGARGIGIAQGGFEAFGKDPDEEAVLNDPILGKRIIKIARIGDLIGAILNSH